MKSEKIPQFITLLRQLLAPIVLLGGLAIWGLHYSGLRLSISSVVNPSLRGEAAVKSLKEQGLYDSLVEVMGAARYNLHQDTDRQSVWQGVNDAHGLRAKFSPEGVQVEVRRVGRGSHRMWFKLRGVGYGEREMAIGASSIEGENNRIEIRRSIEGIEMSEWFVNTAAGLEQGFTLSAPPGKRQGEEHLRVMMTVEGDLRARGEGAGQAIEFENARGEEVLRYEKLVVEDAQGRRLEAVMRAGASELWIEVDDRNATYPVTIDPTFVQQAYLKASNTEANDAFGSSVAISGETVVVGAYGEDSNANEVNGDQNDNSAAFAGAAYVFVRTGTTWSQQAYLKASDSHEFDGFGTSVSISGETVVVGAPSAGAAYVFVRAGTVWSQQSSLKASNTIDLDGFGTSVSISGETVVVGAPSEDSNATGVNGNQNNDLAFESGAAYVFVRNGTLWSQQAYLKASNTGEVDAFGSSVAISGETVVVGAPYEDSNATGVNGNGGDLSINFNAGAAYVFVRSGTTWNQQAYLKASNPGALDRFGTSVAISGNTVVVGADNEGSGATGVNGDQGDDPFLGSSGAAYVFVRSGGTWSQQAYLKASNTGPNDGFGSAVAISGNTVVVGAAGEASNATGVNGNQNDNSTFNAGAGYLFVRSGTTWSQQAYLKASNTTICSGLCPGPVVEFGDRFGTSVAISSETIVIGAFLESSNATGINGDQSNNSASDSGAAYIFFGPFISPTVATSIIDPSGCTGPGDALTVTLEVTNSSEITPGAVATTALPSQLLALPGSCSATIGTCTVVNASAVSWSGPLAAEQKVTITFQAQVAAGTPSGTQLCTTSTATLGGGPSAISVACATVNCSGPIPGLPLSTGLAEASDQKAGSVLIYNIYSSSSSAPARQNTRISITNTDPAREVAVHLFFIEGSTCSVADRYICLTPSQTTTLLASEQDPGTTGYLVAVAVDSRTGCPINFNHLIGDEFVKFESGHAANLNAESVSAIAGGLPLCDQNSVTARLAFDGVSYGRVGAVLASSSIQSPGDGNETLLVVNRINGDLTTTASTIGSLFGVLYNDAEQAHSFTLPNQPCQLRQLLSNTFPRTTPRFEILIPAGRSGWMKLWSVSAFGLLGAQINFNRNAAMADGAFNQGRNLHKLRLSNSGAYTVPIFPPAC